ncbi:PD-(D/E)XK nuclease family protein, partial [Lactobacillus mulieris]
RRINLENLYERANSYESAGFKGLYQFINFINRMRKNQKDLAQPLLSKEAENSVQLMTIHASKGLEFPIVFYLGLEHQFQKSDLSGNYIISGDSCGITVVRSDWRIDSLVKAMGNVTKQKQLLEEEARIMYVAVTRARQKLILVTNFKEFSKDTENMGASLANDGSLTLTSELAAQKPADLLLPQLALNRQFINQVTDLRPEVESKQDFLVVTGDAEAVELVEKQDVNEEGKVSEFIVKNVKKLFEATYPFQDATTTTAYQSVSELKKAFNDPIDDELANSRFIKSANRYLQDIDTRPGFLFEDGFTGAEIGTAMHLILQFFDYQGKTSVEAEIEKLVQSGKLNPKIVPHLPITEISWFVNSNFAKKFWNDPTKLKREVSFSSLLPAADVFKPFSDPNAKILVHGTIDGYYLDDDGIILFDYKTDYVNKNQLAQSIAKIKDKYTGQLRLYERALNQLGKEKVKSKYLILLDAQEIVEVD